MGRDLDRHVHELPFQPEFGVVDVENSAVHVLGSLDNQVTLTRPTTSGC
jgi:hypothetical protein